ncbi:MAG: ECF transporter S component [Candidatus Fermentithermobacillus carboniphilus]|uniref:ECF transporter S component n=1 Tax=Candidatus Fermentithermobacillus carboniphilus TaxID=3085328 RepID=A0AAT9LAC7_9FIRM|nr:MAG: ECF transporter S component [Candidatus Fermentithermobacillus carboniphilus]
MKDLKIRRLTSGALLLALSLMIPLFLAGTVTVALGPFTATPASHVPTFLAMLLGPGAAAMVGFGSAVGFFVKLGPLVGMRAAMHVPVGILGAYLVKKKTSFALSLAAVAPVHAILEALIVLPFGFSVQKAGFLVGLGTLVHHSVDAGVALLCWGILRQVQNRSSGSTYQS